MEKETEDLKPEVNEVDSSSVSATSSGEAILEPKHEIDYIPEISNKSFGRKVAEFVSSQRGWLFLIPALIFLCIFTFYPIVNTVISSFREGYSPIGATTNANIAARYPEYAKTYWGFWNYTQVFQNSYFWNCLGNTALFAITSVVISTALALLIAVGLNSIKKLRNFYQTILFLPYLTNALSIGAVFAVMFQVQKTATPNVGLINTIFGTSLDWMGIGHPWLNRIVIIVYEVWSGLPFKILVLFGALQNVGKQYYDAAKIDGASKATTLFKITVPLISPMLSYLIITGFIGGFKSYTAIVGLFGEKMGPNNDYEMGTIVGLIYGFLDGSIPANYPITLLDGTGRVITRAAGTGVASAAAIILFLIIFVFTQFNMWISKRSVHY